MLSELYKKKAQNDGLHYFRSEGYIKDILIEGDAHNSLRMETLPPFLRTLMITDGTVTKTLEAYYWEPIIVKTLDQHAVETEHDIEGLHSKKGEQVLIRHVQLYGKNSGNIYVTACSVIRQQLLPEQLRIDLLAEKIGMGVLIRDSGLETYREILNMGTHAQQQGVINLNSAKSIAFDSVYRTYQIKIHHNPVIIITEQFPLCLY